jgi:hypothetical protein
MDTAIAGLVGVGVGAVATGGIQAAAAWFDRRLTARSSARLVYMQLHDAQAAIEDLRERRSWENMITDWERYGNEWAKHSVPLARTLKTNKFLNVASAWQASPRLEQRMKPIQSRRDRRLTSIHQQTGSICICYR